MTKTELLSTYTAEQLAEMVVELRNVSKLRIAKCEVFEDKELLKGKCDKCGEEFILSLDNKYILCAKAELYATQEANRQLNKDVSKLQSEVEKYRKAFEYAKKERDCQVAEYRKKIEELTDENKKYIEQIMSSIPLLYGYSVSEVARAIFEHCNSESVRMSNKNRFDYRKEMEKTAKDGCEIYILSLIKCLQGLCSGENYTEENVLTKFVPTEPIKVAEMLITAKGECEPLHIGNDVFKDTYRIFEASELRQIAEHLLVYCNHNGEAKE